MIVTDMCDYLSPAHLKTIILNAIPEQQEQDLYIRDAVTRHLVHVRAPVHDNVYSDQFGPDSDALEFLDLIHSAVRTHDHNTLTLIHDEFDRYWPIPSPIFYQPILLIFKKWCDLSVGNPPTRFHTSHSTPPSNTPSLPNPQIRLTTSQTISQTYYTT